MTKSKSIKPVVATDDPEFWTICNNEIDPRHRYCLLNEIGQATVDIKAHAWKNGKQKKDPKALKLAVLVSAVPALHQLCVLVNHGVHSRDLFAAEKLAKQILDKMKAVEKQERV